MKREQTTFESSSFDDSRGGRATFRLSSDDDSDDYSDDQSKREPCESCRTREEGRRKTTTRPTAKGRKGLRTKQRAWGVLGRERETVRWI
jgi:hypothetical protein